MTNAPGWVERVIDSIMRVSETAGTWVGSGVGRVITFIAPVVYGMFCVVVLPVFMVLMFVAAIFDEVERRWAIMTTRN